MNTLPSHPVFTPGPVCSLEEQTSMVLYSSKDPGEDLWLSEEDKPIVKEGICLLWPGIKSLARDSMEIREGLITGMISCSSDKEPGLSPELRHLYLALIKAEIKIKGKPTGIKGTILEVYHRGACCLPFAAIMFSNLEQMCLAGLDKENPEK
ncbi:hypothetical protein AN958_01419 [Leucoagaricus sp. SymC.cos]|nr:hypothetical protein AN958_01419 [Leucoagaricus sp. SymC.cos]